MLTAVLVTCLQLPSDGPPLIHRPVLDVASARARLAEPTPITEQPLRRFKKQALQKVSVSGGWLAATSDEDVSTSFGEVSAGVGVPLGSFENILVVTPSFRVDRIAASSIFDVPDEVYEAGIQFFLRKPLGEKWSAMAIVRPSVRSDFSTSDEAFRVFGLGLLTRKCWSDELSVSFGAVYLDRADLPLLPAAGLLWTPRPEVRLDLTFPRSRLAWRLEREGMTSETWTYLSTGIGGNTWAVTRPSGLTDELSLRDIRCLVGLEKIRDGGGGWFVETGYAFRRRLEYERTDQEFELSDGIVLQAGWSW